MMRIVVRAVARQLERVVVTIELVKILRAAQERERAH
jgi:hypothetical protein